MTKLTLAQKNRILEENRLAVATAEADFAKDKANNQLHMMAQVEIEELRADAQLNNRIKEIRATKNYIDRAIFGLFCKEYTKYYMEKYLTLRRAYFYEYHTKHGLNGRKF